MYQKEIVISANNGIHARPAAKIVKQARTFFSKITFSLEERSVDAKSLFELQTLGLVKGVIVKITAEGVDEKQAVEKLVQLIKDFE